MAGLVPIAALNDSRAHAEQRWNDRRIAAPVHAPAWRVWDYDAPAVVLGRSQWRRFAETGAAVDVPLIGRASGGGAVLVGPWMAGLSVALPVDHPLIAGGLVDAYRWLGECIAGVLRAAGIAGAQALSPGQVADARASFAPATLAWACFGSLSPWEVTVGGRKIAGLAQVRRRTGVLLVGGVLLARVDWTLLCAALGEPASEAETLTEITTDCARHTTPERARAVPSMLAAALGATLGVAAG